MPALMLECQNCYKVFQSGIYMKEGSSATLQNNKSQCPFCRSMENIPNGTFMATVNGFIDLLKDSKNPLRDAKEILKGLEQKNLSQIQQKYKIENFLENNKRKIVIAMALLKILIDLLSKEPNIEINSNIVNQNFYSQYNEHIEINIK